MILHASSAERQLSRLVIRESLLRDVIDDWRFGSLGSFSVLLFSPSHIQHIFNNIFHSFSLRSPFSFYTRLKRKGEKLDFVQCIGCSLVLQYRSRTGTASLLRHRCAKFPVSIQDQKLESAGRFTDLLSNMASSSDNSAIELKQEIMSDEESLGLQIINEDDDQQYTTEQTNKGLMESFSLLEKSFMTVDEMMLSREEVEVAQRTNDPQLYFER